MQEYCMIRINSRSHWSYLIAQMLLNDFLMYHHWATALSKQWTCLRRFDGPSNQLQNGFDIMQ